MKRTTIMSLAIVLTLCATACGYENNDSIGSASIEGTVNDNTASAGSTADAGVAADATNEIDTTAAATENTAADDGANGSIAIDETSVEAQLQLILNSEEVWLDELLNPEYMPTAKMAVTDLNRNGRLEVIITLVGGTGIYSTSNVYEVSEDYQSMAYFYGDDSDGTYYNESDSSADFFYFTCCECYKKGDTYYYVMENFMSCGYDHKEAQTYAYSFDGYVKHDLISSYVLEPYPALEKKIAVKFGDSEGNSVHDIESYKAVYDNYWEGYEKQPNCEIYWVHQPYEDSYEKLVESYNGFNTNSTQEPYRFYYDAIYDEDYEYVVE